MQILFFLLLPAAAIAQPKGFTAVADEAAFRKKFAEASQAYASIQCDFTQEKNMQVLTEKVVSKGAFSFKKENKVRMEYKEPYQYLLVIDKDKITTKESGKVKEFPSRTKKIFESITKMMAEGMQGKPMDNKDFSVTAYENPAEYLMVLVPKNKSMKELFSAVSLYIDRKDHSVNAMEMTEPSGDNTVISFTNKKFNIEIPDSQFVLK